MEINTRPSRAGSMTAQGDHIKSIRDRILAFDHAMNAREVAKLFGTHLNTIYNQAKSGDMPSFRVGSSIRFDPKELAEWFAKH